jgi:glycosyltransferase involved in cell wall biosynthesis
MRIAFVTNRPAHYRLPIFRLLAERWDVDFFFTATSVGRWWTPEHEECTTGLASTTGMSAATLYRALRKGKYDCIVASLTGRTHLAATAAAVDVTRYPFALWVELWEYPRSAIHALGRPLVNHLLRRADAVVAGGKHTAAWVEHDRASRSRVFVLRNPVDNAFFGQRIPAERVAAMRTSFDLDVDAISCFVGRLEPEKGLPILLQAVSQVLTRVGVVVVGSGSRANEIDSLAAKLGIRDRVRPLGWGRQEELPNHYRACDFLVLPSVSSRRGRETWGLVANEAMIGGLPVVATDAVGAAEGGLIVDGETGLIVPERDPSALAEAIERLSSDSVLRSRLGLTARETAGAYTFEHAAETFAAAVNEAVESMHRG